MNSNNPTQPVAPREMRPEFSQELYRKLDQLAPTPPEQHLAPHWRPIASLASVGIIVAALALSPTARAAAEGFLNLFRVQRITALPIDPARIQQLRESQVSKLDIESLIGEISDTDAQTLEQQAKPQLVSGVAEAAQVSGLAVRVPAAFSDATQLHVSVQREQRVNIRGNVARMQALVNALGVEDVVLPPQLDGAQIGIHKPAAVMMTYGEGREAPRFLQARSPEVTLPEGVSLAQLGEIGLRIAGLSPAEAQRIAQSTDWTSTLFIPIPADAASFRDITLNDGSAALLVTTGGTGASSVHDDSTGRQHSTLLWSKDGIVYALTGGFVGDVVDLANNLK